MTQTLQPQRICQVLIHLRQNARLSIEEASAKAETTSEWLEAVEAGQIHLHEHQLVELALLYGRAIAAPAATPAPMPTPPQTREVRPCTVKGCVDGEHTWIDGEKDEICFTIGISSGPDREFYVAGYRNDVTGLWEAFSEDPELGSMEGTSGLLLLEQFTAAYRAVHQHCEGLNKLERNAQ